MMSQTAGLRKGENDGAVIKSEALEVCNKKTKQKRAQELAYYIYRGKREAIPGILSIYTVSIYIYITFI